MLTALEKDPERRFGSVRAFAAALDQAWQAEQAFNSAPTLRAPVTTPTTQPTEEIPLFSPPSIYLAPLDKDVEPPLVSTPESILVPTSSNSDTVPNPLVAESLSTPEPIPSPLTATDAPRAISSAPPVVPSKRGISRRAVLIGLGGLAVAGSSITWLALTRRPQVSSPPVAVRIPSPSPTSAPVPLGTLLYTYRGHVPPIVRKGAYQGVDEVAWSPDGKRIVSTGSSANYGATVQVWDAANGDNVFFYRGHAGFAYAVAWSPDGKYIASAGSDKTVQVWDAVNGGNVYTYRGHNDVAFSVTWSPNGKRIASSSQDSTVQVWDATDGGNAFIYHGHADGVVVVAWSPDGKRIASGGWGSDTTVQVWDATDGGNAFIYHGHAGNNLHHVAWSPNSKRLVSVSNVSASNNKAVQVWDAVNGGNVFVYRGHPDAVVSVAWSPDGRRIASGNEDVQVWDAADGGNAFIYHRHTDQVNTVAWSPDGRRIASGGWDATVQVWQAV